MTTTLKKLSSKPAPDCEMTKMVDGNTPEPKTPDPKFASKSLDALIKSKVVGKMSSQAVIDKLKEEIDIEFALDEMMTRADVDMNQNRTAPDTHIHIVNRATKKVVGIYPKADKSGIMDRMKAMKATSATHAFVPGGPTV